MKKENGLGNDESLRSVNVVKELIAAVAQTGNSKYLFFLSFSKFFEYNIFISILNLVLFNLLML